MQLEIAHLSHSSIDKYLLCARKWRFNYVEKLVAPRTPALAFGDAFHRTIRAAVEARVAGDTTDPLSIWPAKWAAAITEGSEIDWGSQIPEQAENDGHRMFGSIPVRQAIRDLLPLIDGDGPAFERRVELRVPGIPVPIIGYMDMIAADGVVCDFKTAARAWTEKEAQSEVQPLYYLAAQNQRHGTSELRFRHIVFTKTREPKVQIIDTRRTVQELFFLFEMVRQVWEAIQDKHFPPNPRSCNAYGRQCEFFNRCWRKGN